MSQAPLAHWQGEPAAAWCAAWDVPLVEAYARIGSTNDRALVLAADARNAFAVVIAEEQTEGRGRRGATWHSPPGVGLWMSTVLPWRHPGAHVTLLVGLAVAEAIESVSAVVRVGIKWPNDLMIRGRKVGGVLCESAGAAVVAGIGVNLRAPAGALPGVLSERATALETESGMSLSQSTLAGIIVRALKRRVEVASALDQAALAELEARDVLARRSVDTDEHGRGTARGVDSSGALVLERADGSRVRVVAGSVRPL